LLLIQLTRHGGTAVSATAKVLVGLVLVAQLLVIATPAGDTVEGLFFGLFGVILILLPWTRRLQLSDASPVQAQLAVALIAITVIVVTSTIAVLGEREERSTVDAQLTVNQAMAEALSANVTEYVRLHQQALAAVASVPGLSALPPDQQASLLRAMTRAYPDVLSFSTYAPDGRGIARGDDRTPVDSTSDWIRSAAAGLPVPG